MDSKELANKIRIHALEMTHNAKSSHIGSCLSIADILAVLYNEVLNINPSQPSWQERDKFILSKGHACAIVYAVLAECGFFSTEELNNFYRNGSPFSGHISHHVPGVEVSTGSLGNGLSIGCGMALTKSQNIYVLLGDGECNEGQVWEAAMFASHHCLDNLIAIVDYNKLQALGEMKDILDLEPFAEKWRAFGWQTEEIDGHNYIEIRNSLQHCKYSLQPSCIIAHTTKGMGVSFMENKVEWHYKYPNEEELEMALKELR